MFICVKELNKSGCNLVWDLYWRLKGGREKLSRGHSVIGRPARMVHEGRRPLWHLPKFQISPSLIKESLEKWLVSHCLWSVLPAHETKTAEALGWRNVGCDADANAVDNRRFGCLEQELLIWVGFLKKVIRFIMQHCLLCGKDPKENIQTLIPQPIQQVRQLYSVFQSLNESWGRGRERERERERAHFWIWHLTNCLDPQMKSFSAGFKMDS